MYHPSGSHPRQLITGFIDVFGTVRDPVTGAMSLNSTYVSIWAGTNFAIQVIFQCISPLTADRFGLKPNMFAFTLLMVIVSSMTRTTLIRF